MLMLIMTNLPEARLAREAGMSYATLALATDYDCWHLEEEAVTVETVVATMNKNVAKAREVIRGVAQHLARPDAPQTSPYKDIARTAIMTAPSAIPPDRKRTLRVLFGDAIG